MNNCKPFVKWVGGKTQLLKHIETTVPANFKDIKNFTYIEPFVGGGAVLFWMLKNYSNIERAVINDINPDLTNCYTVIKNNPQLLISCLSEVENEFLEFPDDNLRKEYFLNKRERYNYCSIDEIERAGLFIFLNRTCFNGLYRVNKKGLFNVPFGKYSHPKICDKLTILADSEALQKVDILTGDFTQTLDSVGDNNIFYFDPPYKPISKTSSFTTYTKEDFDDSDQLRLSLFCDKLDKLGHTFILSNSDIKNIDQSDDFFDNLYDNFEIKRVDASRMINSKGDKRGKISELIITNTKTTIDNYERMF